MKFNIGDIVICINNSGLEEFLKQNGQYVVNDIEVCSCGCITLDVGINNQDKELKCKECGDRKGITNFFRSARFVKKETKSKSERLKEAELNEDYELCSKILQED